MNSAQVLRHTIISGSQFDGPDNETIIRNVRADLLEAKSILSVFSASSNQEIIPDGIGSARIRIFLSSLVLVSLGDKDAIADVIIYYNYMPIPVQRVGNLMRFIVPVPLMFRDRPANLEYREWIQNNKARLEWDSEHEHFVLSDG